MSQSDLRIAVYAGSFDPITLGHLNVIQRSRRLFDKLIVGVGKNLDKRALFSLEERVRLVKCVTASFDNVEVRAFPGLTVDFVRSVDARVMVRGVRALTDIATEFTMMLANRQLDADIETVFLMADEEFAHISSSVIKQITSMADEKRLANFLPGEIIPEIRKKIPLQVDLPPESRL